MKNINYIIAIVLISIIVVATIIVYTYGNMYDTKNYYDLRSRYSLTEIEEILKEKYSEDNMDVTLANYNNPISIYSLTSLYMDNNGKDNHVSKEVECIGVNLHTGIIFSPDTGKAINLIGKDMNILTPEETILLLDRKLSSGKMTIASAIFFKHHSKGNIIIKEQIENKERDKGYKIVTFIVNPITRQVYDLNTGDFMFFLENPNAMPMYSK